MAAEDLRLDALDIHSENVEVESSPSSCFSLPSAAKSTASSRQENVAGGGVQVTCFNEIADDVTLNFQIIRLAKQIYIWIGCNSSKFGRMYAAAPSCPNNTVSVTCLLGGASDNTGSSLARRLVLKTGVSIILVSNIPKNNPLLEANAEKKLVEKLIERGYAQKRTALPS